MSDSKSGPRHSTLKERRASCVKCTPDGYIYKGLLVGKYQWRCVQCGHSWMFPYPLESQHSCINPFDEEDLKGGIVRSHMHSEDQACCDFYQRIGDAAEPRDGIK